MQKAPHARCDECPLKNEGFAPSEGTGISPDKLRAIIVSRSPGVVDVREGGPFRGKSGRLLDSLLTANGVERSECFISNVVLCTPNRSDSKLQKDAIKACKPRLDAELSAITGGTTEFQKADAAYVSGKGSSPADDNSPTGIRILALGQDAAEYFTGSGKVNEQRGHRIHSIYGDVVVSSNPAAALRNDNVWPDLQADFRRAFSDSTPRPYPEVVVITNRQRLADELESKNFHGLGYYLGQAYKNDTPVAVDIESTGLSPLSELVMIAIAPISDRVWVLTPTLLKYLKDTEDESLNDILEIQGMRYLWHNGIFDTAVLRNQGINARIWEDTLLQSYTLDERQRHIHSVEYLTQDVLNWEKYETEEVELAKKNGWFNIPIEVRYQRIVPPGTPAKYKYGKEIIYRECDDWESAYRYNGYDAAGSRMVYFEKMAVQCNDSLYEKPYKQTLIPAANMLADVRRRGCYYDVEKSLALYEGEVKPKMDELTETACDIINGPVNLNSPDQCRKIIYHTFGLPDLGVSKTVQSTDGQTRSALLEMYHPEANSPDYHFLKTLDGFKDLSTLASRYLLGLPQKIDSDGKLRTDFLLHGTETGRLSSQKPNLQNISRGPFVRQLFYAPEGYKIIQIDYSQAELRAVAILSGDEHLLDVYKSGRDLHSEVATEFFGPNFDKEQRVIAKAINFGIVFGQAEYSFSRDHGIGIDEARQYIRQWWKTFPQVKAWRDSIHKEAKKKQFLRSPFGNIRRFHLLTEENFAHSMKEAVNFKPQCTASHLTLHSAVEIDRRIGYDPDEGIILLVHDSVVMLVRDENVNDYMHMSKSVFENQPHEVLGNDWAEIPFNADVAAGVDWGHVEEYVQDKLPI